MKKRYTNEKQILREIDRVRGLSVAYLARAEESKANGLDAKKFYRLAAGIEDKRLPKLGRKLAEFRTQIMPGIIEDESIPVKL